MEVLVHTLTLSSQLEVSQDHFSPPRPLAQAAAPASQNMASTVDTRKSTFGFLFLGSWYREGYHT